MHTSGELQTRSAALNSIPRVRMRKAQQNWMHQAVSDLQRASHDSQDHATEQFEQIQEELKARQADMESHWAAMQAHSANARDSEFKQIEQAFQKAQAECDYLHSVVATLQYKLEAGYPPRWPVGAGYYAKGSDIAEADHPSRWPAQACYHAEGNEVGAGYYAKGSD